MPISEIVKAWCKERNARTGANRWFLVLLLALLVCFGVFWNAFNFWPIGVAVVLTLLWLVLAPKPIQYGQLRTSYRSWFVEDSLLARLADAQAVPEWSKTAIANELEKHHRIMFETLFDIEGWIESEASRERVERQRGFQKMVAFSQKKLGR
jgi:hypothetical protein